MFADAKKLRLPTASEALPGRSEIMPLENRHHVLGTPLRPPFPEGSELGLFGLGCFWGAERKFWKLPGVHSTSVGYAAGVTPNPTYREVCSGITGHNEVVRVVFDPQRIDYRALLRVFFESHNPTQGMRQGNDVGTQYRSGIYCYGADQQALADAARKAYEQALRAKGFEPITTEVIAAPDFYYAEDYHQQYLAKNPQGYCGLGGTGITCEI